jgi:hypothetical protein
MAHLPPRYLQRHGRKHKALRRQDRLWLVECVKRAAGEELIGFEDAVETMDRLINKLLTQLFIDPSVLESALWSANLLHEQGKYNHPEGEAFETFARRAVAPDRFDFYYNCIVRNYD